MPMFTSALESGSILLREGLEALLIIAALAAFLERANAHAKVKALYGGALAAIVASLGLAVMFQLFYSGAHDDRIEAVVMLLAAALMLYMSGWLFLKQDPRAWQAQLKAAADKAISAGTTLSIAAIAFLAVIREGGETVLFLHVLAKSGNSDLVGFWSGLVAAALLLVVAFVAIRSFAMRLPLRPLFVFTSLFLFVMALKFIGGAIQEFQEMQLMSVTAANVPQFMIEWGVNPTWEAISVQIMLALLAIGGTAFAMTRTAPAVKPAAAE